MAWGDIELDVTSMSYTRSATGEMDITCIGTLAVGLPYKDQSTGKERQDFNSGGVIQDSGKTHAFWPEEDEVQRRVVKAVDYGVIDPGKLNCEFLDVGQLSDEHVGIKKRLVVVNSKTKGYESGVTGFKRTESSPHELADNVANEKNMPSRYAYLTELGSSFAVGEFVKCNCTFTFTG